MKHLFMLALLAFSLTSCASPSASPLPTHTPFPTYTPFPTFTPLPSLTPYPTFTPYPTLTAYPIYTPLPATPTSLPPPSRTPLSTKTIESQPVADKCIAWDVASSHIGETTCVRGIVTNTYKDAKSNAFFIDFDDARTSFYAISFRYVWGNVIGRCVEISGKIAPYNGRPQIVVESKDQLTMCE
jgi:hypothetical protein